MDKTLNSLGFSEEDILKVKIWWSSHPKNYSVDGGNVDPRRKVIQNDDHDTQYADYRGLTDDSIDGKKEDVFFLEVVLQKTIEILKKLYLMNLMMLMIIRLMPLLE